MNPSPSADAPLPEAPLLEAPLLEANGLFKAYGRREVLRGVDLRVAPGQLTAVLGENGAGKSTLLKILAAAEAADAGRLERRGSVGYCPQDQTLYPGLTLAEHFRLFGAATRRAPAELEAAGQALVDRFQLQRHRDTPVAAMSGGTRQKLNLALALLHDPAVLLLDEPYSGFDREAYRQFIEWTTEAKRLGKGVVLVTHLLLERGRFDVALQLREGVLEAADGEL